MRFKTDIRKLLKLELKQFWPNKQFNNNVNWTEALFKRIKFFQRVVVTIGYIVIFMLMLRPLFDHQTVFLLKTWHNRNYIVLDTLLLFLEYYIMYFAFPPPFAFDFFYVSFCVNIIVQLKLIKRKLEDLLLVTNTEISEEIRFYIKHHQLLLL